MQGEAGNQSLMERVKEERVFSMSIIRKMNIDPPGGFAYRTKDWKFVTLKKVSNRNYIT